MTSRVTIAAAIVVICISGVLLLRRSTSVSDQPQTRPAAGIAPSLAPSTHSGFPEEQIHIDLLSRQEIAAEVDRRDRTDTKWEWKIPIRFYGLVVDQDNQPIAGAEVHLQWTDLSAKGTADLDVKTDERGRFVLDQVRGKRLGVRIMKPGYYSSDSRNQWSFEYANPFEEIFHQPKPQDPIVFRLRKHGPAVDLIRRSAEVVLPGDGTATGVRLGTGKIDASGELRIQTWKPWPARPMSPPYDWKVTLTLDGGGFTDARGDFPFEAPAGGYELTYAIDMPAGVGPAWKVSAERTLYFTFGEPRRYGRLSLRTDGNSRYVFINYVINPAGDRNLEDPQAFK